MSSTVMVAMSGGVDSSVSALLIKKQGYDLAGAMMRLHDKPAGGTGEDDEKDAEAVAKKLGIPFFVFDMRDEFKKIVIGDFVKSYLEGRTPNPCVLCNGAFKFGALLSKASEMGFDKIATGHYARIKRDEKTGVNVIEKASYSEKDQSYVLWRLKREQIDRILFPLGEMRKDETRDEALKNGLINAKKKESQDICFIPDGDYAGFIEAYTKKKCETGFFEDRDGNILGRHKGIIHYTVGQHRGLGIALGKTVYVNRIEPERNAVILGDNENLFSNSLNADEANWCMGEPPGKVFECRAKIRYRQQEQPCEVTITGKDTFKIRFMSSQRAVTPGQSAVLYDGDRLLGGGVIV